VLTFQPAHSPVATARAFEASTRQDVDLVELAQMTPTARPFCR
jgi:hypothetical protein